MYDGPGDCLVLVTSGSNCLQYRPTQITARPVGNRDWATNKRGEGAGRSIAYL